MTETNDTDRCPACWKLVEEEIADASRSYEDDLVEYFPDFRRIKCDECKAKDPQSSELEQGPVLTPEMRAIHERLKEISRRRIASVADMRQDRNKP